MKTIKADLQPIVKAAGSKIVYRTLFECPFPTVWDLSGWITEAWMNALEVTGKEYEICDELCRREVNKSFHDCDTQPLTGLSYAVDIRE